MKPLCLAAGLMVTVAARGARVVSVPAPLAPAVSSHVVAPAFDFSEVSEEELFKLLRSTDRFVRNSAFRSLSDRWRTQASQGGGGKEKDEKEEVDKGVKTLLDILKNASERDDAILAAGALAYTTPDRAHHTVIAKHLRAAVVDSKEIWTRVHSANALHTFFLARGEALDGESVKVMDKLLQECSDRDGRYYLLWNMTSMGSDCLPFKGTLEKLRDSSDGRIAETAKNLLAGMDRKMDAAKRKKMAFPPVVWN